MERRATLRNGCVNWQDAAGRGEFFAVQKSRWYQEETSGKIRNLLVAASDALKQLNAHENMRRAGPVCNEHQTTVYGPLCLTRSLIKLATY
jgi:hypothetical protein